ncbi:MAG: mechanosensitive ion channel family protein [Verrucomicrobia bacterium]|nr:mechanosensitive ion channel family protein [Verrucomicrobiota bacterium]MBU4365807.1 mechanosensitive ion channel family protein [Verrucomicrobiota bacterium]
MYEFLWQTSIAGNELWKVLVFFAAILFSLIAGRLARFFMQRAADHSREKKKKMIGLLLAALSRPVVMAAFTLGWWLGIAALTNLGPSLRNMADTIGHTLNAIAIGYALYSLVDIVDYYLLGLARKTESKVDDVLAPLVGKSIRITVFVLVLLNVIQQVSGKSITTILAGLGVAGLAIALAGQDTIKNFFGSLVILMDKPFEIGERIVVDNYDGPVESIGFRSTRIRTFDGHQITIPNSEMVNKTIQNIGRRPFIRHLASITITYDTPPEKVQRALDIIKEILNNHEGMHPEFPPRVYFNAFNDASLNIIMIYWYHPPGYWEYMQFSEHVNQQILERFNAESIDFAFPTQTIYLANDDKRQMTLRLLRGQP